jgi:hypothetical protein
MGRPRVYPDAAARQRAYRERQREQTVLRGLTEEAGGTYTRAPFRVADEQGKPLLEVSRQDGVTSLLLFDPAGREVLELLVGIDYSSVVLRDGDMTKAVLEGNSAGGLLELLEPNHRSVFRLPPEDTRLGPAAEDADL